MINVFKKHAPEYQRLVRRFALETWKGKGDKRDFFRKAELFKRKYENDLRAHYAEEGVKIYPRTIVEKANAWYHRQEATIETIETLALAKKENVTAELFEKLKGEKSAEAQKLINKIYLHPKDIAAGAEVWKVYSFKDNLEDRAEQIGEQEAFDLGSDINHAVVQHIGDTYRWNTQHDLLVRWTHEQLDKKTFSYDDPPTTIDQYGRRHTGHCGTDWGCRCFETPSKEKPLLHFIVRQAKKAA